MKSLSLIVIPRYIRDYRDAKSDRRRSGGGLEKDAGAFMGREDKIIFERLVLFFCSTPRVESVPMKRRHDHGSEFKSDKVVHELVEVQLVEFRGHRRSSIVDLQKIAFLAATWR